MNKIFLLLLFCSSCSELQAQVDTLYTIPSQWIHTNLKTGTAQYLVFIKLKQKPKQSKTFVWERTTSIKHVNGNKQIEVVQHWYGADSTDYRYLYSRVDGSNFLPMYHKTISQRTGVEAYDFYHDKLRGSDSVVNNKKATFELMAPQALNWELDLETFGLLELREGKRFAIHFYHPGGRTTPQLYEYKVTGSDKIMTFDGRSIDCWKLRIDYSPRSYAIYWIGKKSKEVIKMAEDFGMGTRYKIRLATQM